MTHFQKKLVGGLIIMLILSPLGLILSEKLSAGGAWGEWDLSGIEKMMGYIPAGMKKIGGLWKAPIPDYNLGGGDSSMTSRGISYIVSGLLGVIFVGGVIYVLSKLLFKRKQ